MNHKKQAADSESRLGRAQTRMPAGIRGFPLPKGNRYADKHRCASVYLRSSAFICGFISHGHYGYSREDKIRELIEEREYLESRL